MANNPITYSDLIKPDGSIQQAIKELQQLQAEYEKLLQKIRQEASGLKNDLSGLSGATDGYRKKIQEIASAANSLSEAQKNVQAAMEGTAQRLRDLTNQQGQTNTATASGTSATQAQASSYAELEGQINRVAATRRELVTALSREEVAIRSLNSQLSNLKKQQDVAYSDSRQSKIENLNNRLVEHKNILSDVRQQLNNVVKMENAVPTSIEGMSQELSRMRVVYRKLAEEERSSPFGQQLLATIRKLDTEVKKLDASMGNYQRNVGNYASGWNGLNVAMEQLTKELPSLAVSANTFFLAIANNIPILVDEINRLRAANEAAAASGGKVVPVWRQVASALLSWNTAMSVGVALLTVYGGQIVKWVSNLLKGRDALDVLKTAQDNVDVAMLKGNQDAQQNVVRLQLLYEATQDTTRSINERTEATQQLRREFPAYFQDMGDEEILAGRAADAYLKLRDALLETARARAAQSQMVDNEKEIISLQEQRLQSVAKQEEAQEKLNRLQEQYNEYLRQPAAAASGGLYSVEAAIASVRGEMQKYNDEIAGVDEQINALTEANQRLQKGINIDALVRNPATGLADGERAQTTRGGGRTQRDRTQTVEQKNLNVTKQLYASETALIEDEIEKQRKALQDAYNNEYADLMNKYNNDKDLTEQSRENITQIILNKQQKLQEDLAKLDAQEQQRELQAQQQMLQLRLAAAESGSAQEENIRLELMENQRQQEILANRQKVESVRQDEADINAKYDEQILRSRQEYTVKQAQEELSVSQALAESRLKAEGATEEQLTQFKLQAEKERLEQLLALVESGAKSMSEAEIETVKNTIKSIDNELKGARTKARQYSNIYDVIGESLQRAFPKANSETIQSAMSGVEQYVSFSISQMQEYLEAEVELREQELQLAEEAVSAAQSRLDAEIEARNAGYANNVATAKKELVQEQKKQQQKQKLLEEAQRRQEAIDSLTQVSSLVTAAANIWEAFSKIPFVGPALAAAAIASMFASFAAAKIKARQVAMQAEEYGEGGLEFLEGGSHASGNDIELGVVNHNNRRMKAEGGEAMAIINKHQTRKYRKVLPGIVESLNKGNFEEKYMNAFTVTPELSGLVVTGTGGDVDLRKIEGDLSAIRKRGEVSYYMLPNGDMVVQKRNVKRIVKR